MYAYPSLGRRHDAFNHHHLYDHCDIFGADPTCDRPALAEKFYVIINVINHHDAIFQDPDGQKAKILSRWSQIANYFKGYDHRLAL